MPKPRILLIGAAGQLGRALQTSFADAGELIALDRNAADLSQPERLRQLVVRSAPDVILNAAAYTAVDRAEAETELAMTVNAQAPGILAEAALATGALLVHYSTDYVFDGSKPAPWIEEDAPSPLNVYGLSKLAGEAAIQQVGGKVLIFRTSWVYGPQGNNFLSTMLRLGRERETLKIVDDQVGAPTSSIELARATHTIVDGVLAGAYGASDTWAGLYHMTCRGSVSWCGFAQAIFARAGALLQGKMPMVHPIPAAEYPTPAQRPLNSVLSNEKLDARFGIPLAAWDEALDAVLLDLRRAARTPQAE
jgi:dTDP-4-dehydrorhamnose reductase